MRRLFVDAHRDDKHRVRGLLCFMCKHGLSRYLDEPQLLKAAARYVGDRQTHEY
jgi:Recombination endonuclease VII